MGPGIVNASSNGYFSTVTEAEGVANNGNKQLNDDFVPSSVYMNQYSAGRNIRYMKAS